MTFPVMAAAGTMSYFHEPKRDRTAGFVLRRRMKEALTMMKRMRNMMPAATAMTWTLASTAMVTMATPLTRIAMWGVRLRRWMDPKALGSVPSRPMAKATREAEKMVALRAERAPAKSAPT